MADGFLGRWAKRKNDALQGKPLDEPAPARPAAGSGALSAPSAVPGTVTGMPSTEALAKASPDAPGRPGQEPAAEQAPPLTLDDVQGLTKDSDFKPFMNQAVEPGVRNAAMKKLFADPHFNVMDRMDIYIDDYSQPDPLPASMLRQMASAKFLKLFDDDEEDQKTSQKEQPADGDKAAQAAPAEGHETVAETNLTPVTAADPPSDDNPQPLGTSAEPDTYQDNHAHSDLRLQPDHAAESPDPGRSAA